MNTAQNFCLHYVGDRGPRYAFVSLENLRALIAEERESGRTPISLSAYLTSQPDDQAFSISFDDAHISMLDAIDLLHLLEVTPTLFVPTGMVDTRDEFLDWDGLRQLRDAGWTIGSHTVSHPRMSWRIYEEGDAEYQARLDEECARSREALERKLGVQVSLFAYPYGEAPRAAREAVRRAGYELAFTVDGTSLWNGDRLAIPRIGAPDPIAIESSEPIPFSVVVPACDRAGVLSEVVRRLDAQSYPRASYEVIVVDDGSTDDLTVAVTGRESARLIPSGHGSSRFGAGMARQTGARAARFDHLVFLDADVAVDADFLWHYDWIFRRTPDAVVLGYLSGYNLHDLGCIHLLDAVKAARDLSELPKIPDRCREPTFRACLDNIDWLPDPWKLTYTGNLALSKSRFFEISGFGTDFVGWGLEDVDLGYRLYRAGAFFRFSRFAVGHHIIEPHEPESRNPFRRSRPTREDFADYLTNLEVLRRNHAGDAAIDAYYARALADIEETCRRPDTIGIEFGGITSAEYRFRRDIHRCQPGGVPTMELLDRVAYAAKVGAKRAFLLGGDPTEHPGFLAVLRQLSAAGLTWIGMQTTGLAFVDADFADEASRAGLSHATLEFFGSQAATHDRVFGRRGAHTDLLRAIDHLKAAKVYCVGRIFVVQENAEEIAALVAWLQNRNIPIDEISVVDRECLDRVAASFPDHQVREARP